MTEMQRRMLENSTMVKRMLWPRGFALFALLGIVAGIAADVLSASLTAVTPFPIISLFGVIALVSASLCFQRVVLLNTRDPNAFAKTIYCHECRCMRFFLYALVTYLAILGLSGGQGFTAHLLKADHSPAAVTTAQTGEPAPQAAANVLKNITYMPRIIAAPKTPEEYFKNAWVYANIRSEPENAFKMLELLYQNFAPNKIDAAELYFETGKKSLPMDVLIGRASRQARNVKDASLLVLCARFTLDEKASEALYKEANEIDPDNPFTIWDIQRFPRGATSATDAKTHYEILQKKIKAMEAFEAMLDSNPKEQFFYLPQYQPDFKKVTTQMQAALEIASKAYDELGHDQKAAPPAAAVTPAAPQR